MEKSEERRAALTEAIRNGSVATWAHFNPHGEFYFSGERMVDSIGLTPPKIRVWNRAKNGRKNKGKKSYKWQAYVKFYVTFVSFV